MASYCKHVSMPSKTGSYIKSTPTAALKQFGCYNYTSPIGSDEVLVAPPHLDLPSLWRCGKLRKNGVHIQESEEQQ